MIKIAFEARSRDKVFHYDPIKNTSSTYRDLFEKASAIRTGLLDVTSSGEIVLLSCKQHSNWLPCLLACWIAGVSPAIYAPGFSDENYSLAINEYGLSVLLCDFPVSLPQLASRTVYVPEGTAGAGIEEINVDEESIAILLFSSGTSGKQKCIPLSFANLLDNIQQFSDRIGLCEETVFLCASPLHHAHGLYNSFLTAFFLRASVIFGGQLSMLNIHKLFSHALDTPRLTFHITPSMIPIMLAYASRGESLRLPKFDNLICGTAFLDSNSKEQLESTIGTKLYQQYGMTETLFMSINDRFPEKALSVGVPLAGVQLEICENGRILSAGTPGAIRVRTKSCFGSYYYAAETDNSFRDGYFYTGDIGFLDSDNCLFITGREKDLIKKGGLSISGNFISSVIREVNGVTEAYTLGVRDASVGEEIYCFFSSDSEIHEDEIRVILRKKIAANLMPKKIFRIDEFPSTSTGKIKHTEMEWILKQRLDG